VDFLQIVRTLMGHRGGFDFDVEFVLRYSACSKVPAGRYRIRAYLRLSHPKQLRPFKRGAYAPHEIDDRLNE